ncbi:[protein-PII] uridylyltransferase [Halochromatium glycolicum]|uniref:Bifunctional uridylyltransferase/uridylyl-removing enzyme n=1 Tax=Halochromatium glycolicum TaxID=85075 RepID=A0AAJ0U278_9GAMM|nr:[protein-PII] uridylyltransferase [Halochromatium glycolicum]
MLEQEAELLDAEPGTALDRFRAVIKSARQRLFERYDQGVPVSQLLEARSRVVDMLLRCAWQRIIPDPDAGAMVAVGGYGREELHPASDIDLLILVEAEQIETLQSALTDLVTFLWDIGIELGHSVRTLDECVAAASDDLTVISNLIEARFITGRQSLFDRLQRAIGPDHIWPTNRFFEAKIAEQHKRWRRYGDTAYNLEPNIKENPGGLRDIQMISWVTKRHFGSDSLHELVEHGFLTESEHLALIDGRALLWRIRFALHRLTGRHEDRLLFDYQRTLADQFGYTDHRDNLAVEQFMQQYYRTVMELNRLNEMLLQLFREAILLQDHVGPPEPINRRFQSRSGYLEVTHEEVFKHRPIALLEAFHLLQVRPELHGVRASTIRLIRENRHRIDDDFREDMRARSLFMEILRHPSGVTQTLRRMNRYGVLASYIPAFANIVGRMQYDLFHVYTVDEHTLRVVRNLRRLSVPAHDHELPLCSAVARRVPKLEILYLAGLFHDIAKGRGGDHSMIGAHDAWDFCQLHYLSEFDSRLVAWLVENHLLMSVTAQRKDISDPAVVQAFAEQVGEINRLDYLYLLTVADVRGTNPKRWSSWKDALLRELYQAARRALDRGLDNPQAQDVLIEQKQNEAMRILAREGIEAEDCRNLWGHFSVDFFAPSQPEEIAWQTRRVLEACPDELPIVNIRLLPTRGCSEIFIYTQDRENLFVEITALLDQRNLDIVNARVMTTEQGMALNAFQVLTREHEPLEQGEASAELAERLRAELQQPTTGAISVNRRLPRQLRHFPIETRISFTDDPANQRTLMHLTTRDRPGLLAEIGSVFEQCDIQVQGAKITTVGAEVEDVFFIANRDTGPVRCAQTLNCLRREVHARLDDTPTN